MALSEIVRARVIMDLLKDGTVANEAAYDAVDKIAPPVGMKYLDAMIRYYGVGNTATMSNADKATFLIRTLRNFVRDIYKHDQSEDDRQAAADAASAEVDADLGVEPEPGPE